MKKILHLLVLSVSTLILLNCEDKDDTFTDISEKQLPIQLECNVDEFILNEYDIDAHILAVDLMNSETIGDSDEVFIPDYYVENILRGLSSIYSLNNQSTDSVFNILNIHTFGNEMVLKKAIVCLSGDMINDWKNNGKTSNEELNTLISKYELSIINEISDISVIVIISEKYININALCKKLSKIRGIIYAEPNSLIGDGNDIDISLSSNSLDFRFKHGTGDCPSGCINNEFWSYQVDEFCQVIE